MCALCLKTPCDSRCPNAPEPIPVHVCGICGYGIFEEEKYYEAPDQYVCESCMDDMSLKEFMKIIGEEMKIARGGDYYG